MFGLLFKVILSKKNKNVSINDRLWKKHIPNKQQKNTN